MIGAVKMDLFQVLLNIHDFKDDEKDAYDNDEDKKLMENAFVNSKFTTE